jgi:transposase InsO family protein
MEKDTGTGPTQAIKGPAQKCRDLAARVLVSNALSEALGRKRSEESSKRASRCYIPPPRYRRGIEHRLTKPNHPWTNGQVERMSRTLKEATVQRYHYGTHAQRKAHLHAFLMAYNFAKRLKTLRALTP